MRWLAVLLLSVAACGDSASGDDASSGDGASSDAPDPAQEGGGGDSASDATSADGAPDAAVVCVTVTDAADVPLATASAAGESVLAFTASSASKTSWGTAGNESLVLEIAKNGSLLGHVILHQGDAAFPYSMFTGALGPGDALTARVSTLSAPNAVRSATLCGAAVTPTSQIAGMTEGIDNAPIYVWPIPKRFDDTPLLVGWAKGAKAYSVFFTNENGGTTVSCGGGAAGLAEEIRIWGRGSDIETQYTYGTSPTFERCDGVTGTSALRFEAAHPILYHGDGHNRAFEDRSGYGATCGTSGDAKPDGNFPGWGTANPDPNDDSKYALILRPVPVDSAASAYAFGGYPRERVLTKYAPWLHRLTGLETMREGKVDGSQTFGFARYLHADVYVADVDGSSSSCPITGLNGGFNLRAHTTNTGVTSSAGQITQASCGGEQWKHVSVPLDAVHVPTDFDQLVFDAYDGDGIYLLGIGDVFVLTPSGANGAAIASVRQGAKTLGFYVDDDQSGCVNGQSTYMNKTYPCIANFYAFAP